MKNNLLEIRKNLGLSQIQLANLLGKRQETISKYEKGKRKIPVHTARQLIAIAKDKGINVTLDYIYDNYLDVISQI